MGEKWIEERAYRIWEAEGKPEGRALEHWLRAEADFVTHKQPQAAQSIPAKSGVAHMKKARPARGRRPGR